MGWLQLINTTRQSFSKTVYLRKHVGWRSFSSAAAIQQRVCIVGSGPAGFYTAQHILKNHKQAQVDIFEKLPVPFGLVRYGVAPDHPEVKNATNTFEEVARDERCNFYGNINIGVDVKVAELIELYDAVVLAYGADDDKKLNIPGEDANGVLPARSFVGWYNGLPAHADLSPNLNCETAVVIGHGNVALDVARMLLAPQELLKHTDICSHALEALTNSSINNVHLIGRRGPLEVAFTIKELREMIRLPGVAPVFHDEDFAQVRPLISEVPRQRKRLIELMCKTALDDPSAEEKQQRETAFKSWQLNFFSSPSEILADDQNNVCGVRLEVNELQKRDDGSIAAVGTGVYKDIPCGMVLRSIGYKSIPMEKGIPFDVRLGIIPNLNGRAVQSPTSKDIVKGLYCSGWVKHGPIGVIVTTMNEAYATGEIIVADLKAGEFVPKEAVNIEEFMRRKGINFLTYADYENIDVEEMFRGKQYKKPREKITSFNEMINVAFKDKGENS